MALIKCPECNGKVSDKATACIHCGFPIEDYDPEYDKLKAEYDKTAAKLGLPPFPDKPKKSELSKREEQLVVDLARFEKAMLDKDWFEANSAAADINDYNLQEASQCFLKVAEKGCPAAMVNYGDLIIWHGGNKKKRKEGYDWIAKGVKLKTKDSRSNHNEFRGESICNLAQWFQIGQHDVTPQSEVKQQEWLEYGAKQGFGHAMYELAFLLHNGKGQHKEAKRWAKKALEANYSDGVFSHNLVEMCDQRIECDKQDKIREKERKELDRQIKESEAATAKFKEDEEMLAKYRTDYLKDIPKHLRTAQQCPICTMPMQKLDASSRGSSFGGGQLIGALFKQYKCVSCGHLM
jgi:hypothetical protein